MTFAPCPRSCELKPRARRRSSPALGRAIGPNPRVAPPSPAQPAVFGPQRRSRPGLEARAPVWAGRRWCGEGGGPIPSGHLDCAHSPPAPPRARVQDPAAILNELHGAGRLTAHQLHTCREYLGADHPRIRNTFLAFERDQDVEGLISALVRLEASCRPGYEAEGVCLCAAGRLVLTRLGVARQPSRTLCSPRRTRNRRGALSG